MVRCFHQHGFSLEQYIYRAQYCFNNSCELRLANIIKELCRTGDPTLRNKSDTSLAGLWDNIKISADLHIAWGVALNQRPQIAQGGSRGSCTVYVFPCRLSEQAI